MTGVIINSLLYNLNLGSGQIEYSGTGEEIGYSMYGEDVPEVPRFTFTISATPSDATVIINGEETSSICDYKNTNITWSVSKTGYVTQSGTYVLDDDYEQIVNLVISQFTFTINPTPSDATVTINGQIRNSITANYGTSITWNVSKTGYTTQSGSYILNSSHTENITLEKKVDPYTPGTVLANITNNNTYTATLPAGNYRIRLTGGGGGGSYRYNEPSYTYYFYTGGGGANFEGIIHNPVSQTVTLYAAAFKGTSYLDLGGTRMITCANGTNGWYTYYPNTMTLWQHGPGLGGALTVNSSLSVVSIQTSGNGNNGLDGHTDSKTALGGTSGSTQNWGRGEWCTSPDVTYGGAYLEYISQ